MHYKRKKIKYEKSWFCPSLFIYCTITSRLDPVLVTLTYVFSSNLKSTQNFDMTVAASQILAQMLSDVDCALEPIRLPACYYNSILVTPQKRTHGCGMAEFQDFKLACISQL